MTAFHGPAPSYQIELPVFTGPLDLLLHLIDREELDITAISLANVTEQYLAQVESLKKHKLEQLIDFIVVGARLVLIKSRALLPRPPALLTDVEEEDPAEALLRQLRLYKRFKQAAAWLHEREAAGLRTYLRVAPPPRIEGKLDMSGITAETLVNAFQDALNRVQTLEESVSVVQRPRFTIESQLRHLRTTFGRRKSVSFHELLSSGVDRLEVAVTLLAALELIKRREIEAFQPHPFGPIELKRRDVDLEGEAGTASPAFSGPG